MTHEALQEALGKMYSSEMLFNEPLSQYTSFGVGGNADAIAVPKTEDELRCIIRTVTAKRIPFRAIGNGTNLIVRDGGYRGVIISLRGFKTLERKVNGRGISLYAQSGVPLAALVNLSLQESLTGLEFCAGIPGSVGGAVMMNAGAYGREMKDVLDTISVMTTTGDMCTYGRHEMNFKYRSLTVPTDCLILAATFSLIRGEEKEIRERIEAALALRREKLPWQYPNAGSIFKNPREIPAGQLIDELGLKGMREGDAKVSEVHGNVIVNMGKAEARDILALIARVQEKVFAERGIILETEVHIIGDER
jgi:UDP-N-acetylmuramate dehydrogenase